MPSWSEDTYTLLPRRELLHLCHRLQSSSKMAPRPVSDVGKVLFVLLIFMVTASDGKNSGSLCQLRKSCTLLERMKDQDLDLDSKQRICHLATQALLIPTDDDCEKPAAHAVDTIKPPETVSETLCQLRENCALMGKTSPFISDTIEFTKIPL
ncbi:uncharacterized protein LOC144928655 [Branchiostoma floridae x Branchiostoma belcheri]